MTLLLAAAAGLVLGCVASMPPAGPIALLVLQRGLLRRFREGAAVALGGAAAEAGYAAIAILGMSFLVDGLGWGVRVLAIAVLLGLGIYFLRFRMRRIPAGDATRRSVLFGFGVGASNLALLATWSTLAAVACSLGAPRLGVAGAFAFGGGVGAGIFLWFLILLWALRRFGRRMTDVAVVRCVRAGGALLVGLAVVVLVTG